MVGSCKPTTCTNFLEEDVMNLQQALAFLAGLKPVPLSDQIEMPIKDRYEFEDLIDAGCRKWRNTAPLPLPPMLMFDTITELSKTGGEHGKGFGVAELNLKPDHWFFACHFLGNPLMPGCLGLDGTWQAAGFLLQWLGGRGTEGMATGLSKLKLRGKIRPTNKLVKYRVDVKRPSFKPEKSYIVVDATVMCDGAPVYMLEDLMVFVMPGEKQA